MDFLAIITFILTYFVRPQDWIGFMSGVEIVRPIMILAIAGILMRGGQLSPRTFLRTPIDWLMLLYWVWIIKASPSISAGITAGLSLFGIYYLTVRVLNTLHRQLVFLKAWLAALIALSIMGIGVQHGFDLTGAADLVEHQFVGRLVLNTWLFRNPNALGHTVILAIPLTYLLFVYRKGAIAWLTSLPLFLLPAYCVYLTKSKGAFIVGFMTLVFALLLGRSKRFQICAVLLAVTFGWGAVTRLPRMQELSSLETNEAVMGRMFAWQDARAAVEEHTFGVGWRAFKAEYIWEGEWHTIATHSSYVRVGAELGLYGLLIYLFLLTVCLRQLLFTRATAPTEDRIAKAWLALFFSYILSNWMIDRAYHVEFFLMCAGASALYRYMLDKWSAVNLPDDGQSPENAPASDEAFDRIPVRLLPETGMAVAVPPSDTTGPFASLPLAHSLSVEEREEEPRAMAPYLFAMLENAKKNRFGATPSLWILDLCLAIAFLRLVLWFWNYMMSTLL